MPLGYCTILQATRGLQANDIWLAIVLGHMTRCLLSFGRFRQQKWRDIRVDIEPARTWRWLAGSRDADRTRTYAPKMPE